jgi:hypothetical protein
MPKKREEALKRNMYAREEVWIDLTFDEAFLQHCDRIA